MALRGDLGDFSLADVFRLVTLSGRSGVLRLEHEGGSGSVWFRGGDVFFATSDHRGALLGERLVAAGRITPAQLTRALEVWDEEHQGGRRLGEILIDLGFIDEGVLEQFVQEQIQDTIFDLFLWEDGTFEFELLQSPPEGQDIGLAVSVENIIMESARRLSEVVSLRKQNLAAGIIYRMATMPGGAGVDITLRPEEWQVIRLTDGTRTVSEIAEQAELPLADVARTLHGLRGAGLLEVVEAEEAPATQADAERDEGLAMMAEIASMPQVEEQEAEVAADEPAEPPLVAEPSECPPPEAANTPAPDQSPSAPPAETRTAAPEAGTPAPAEPVPGVDDNYGARNLSERYKIEDVVRPGESIWASVGDELTALTGSVSARKRRAVVQEETAEVEKTIHRDPRVSADTLRGVIEGLERL